MITLEGDLALAMFEYGFGTGTGVVAVGTFGGRKPFNEYEVVRIVVAGAIGVTQLVLVSLGQM